MCGHGTIGTVTAMIEHGLVNPKTPGTLNLDTPAGLVTVTYKMSGDLVEEVTITNVPSFLYAKGLKGACPDLGDLVVDVAYGGNFYAIVDTQEAFSDIADVSPLDLIRWSPALRASLNERYEFVHPMNPDICGLSHILWTGAPTNSSNSARNAVFYGDKAIDRSPCGTGTSARMAQWAAKGDLKTGDQFTHESIIGSVFTGRVEGQTRVGAFEAIIPSISGSAKITGLNTLFIDDSDPFAHGFQVL